MNFREAESGHLFAGTVKAQDAACRIQHYDKSAHGIENGGDDVSLLLQRLFRSLQICDVEAHAMNEPGLSIFLADHLSFAMKPENAPIARQHPISRTQGIA